MFFEDVALSTSIILFIFILLACGFEFVNGFHDAANAVATVIYTNSLKPWTAVIWSGTWNFLGVLLGGLGVAMAIVNLLPVEILIDQDVSHSIAMISAILLTAIAWNLYTWYYGIPCSSSHTLIGSILGVGVAFSLLPNSGGVGVNWSKAESIGLSLILSPIVGFSLTILLMYLLRRFTRKKKFGRILFKEPKKHAPPPPIIRGILVLTCTMVSFSHGNNDGQKGVGLIMLILIGILPTYFAISPKFEPTSVSSSLAKIEMITNQIDTQLLSEINRQKLREAVTCNTNLQAILVAVPSAIEIKKSDRFSVRKNALIMNRNLKFLESDPNIRLSKSEKQMLLAEIKNVQTITTYSPLWVIVLVALSLSIGTLIGWERIVKTIGEKIGKEHLTYSQGACAETMAACTIGISSGFGLPVSTTHVLSSGIAGSMVATKGLRNLQPLTVRNIVLAWVLTLPVVVIMSGSLFLIFRILF